MIGLLAPSPITSPWQVAYVARVYYPAGDPRMSVHQVYLSDLHGGHRRQITTGREECIKVRWLDQATIAWTRADGTLWRLRVDRGRPQLWRRSRMALDEVSLGEEVRNPEQPVFALDRPYRYNSGKLAPFRYSKAQWVGAAVGCDVTFRPAPQPEDDRFVPGHLVWPGGTLKATLKDNDFAEPVTAFAGRKENDLWVLYSESFSTWGTYYELVRYDRSDGQIRWRRRELEDLDFRPDRALYACSTTRTISPLGKVGVWTAPIYIGDWESGKEWPLTRGMVEGWSVSLRP